MSDQGTDLTTPVGRIVWGHPGKPQKKTDPQTKQVKLDQNGQPIMVWSYGVAFDKATFQQSIWPAMAAEAAKGYPNGVPPRFSWKYVDGDGIDSKGQPYNQREGYAGCYVLTISTEFQAPPIFKFNPQSGAYDQLDPSQIKTGDWVSNGLNLKVNVATGTNTPSLYVNPRAVELVGYGQEILSQAAADPNALFGGRQHQLPPGASAVPQQQQGAPGMPGMAPGHMPGAPMQAPPMQQPGPAPMQQPPQMAPAPAPQQYAPQPGQPGQMPPPAPDFVQNATGAAPAPQPMQMPGAPAPQQYQQPGAAPMPGMMPPR